MIAGLKSVETKAYGILEVVVEENLTTSKALNTGMKGNTLNLISEDDFDYSTLNHKSSTPSPISSPNQSPKHTSLPVDESTDVQN